MATDVKERVSAKVYKIQAMLPWGFESRLAFGLATFKIPCILLVTYVGFLAESHLKEETVQSWYRPGNGAWFVGAESGCYAHLLKKPAPGKEIIKVDENLLTTNITFDPFGIHSKRELCNINLDTCLVEGLDEPSAFLAGINHYVPFAFMWCVYKIIFIGIHPIDRISLKLHGNPDPGPNYPEPLLKLLTEPYFQCCTTPMQVLVKMLFYFRYKMLPNTLLGALASMHDMRPACPNLVFYKMSPRFGNTVYYVCIVDLVFIAGSYMYSKCKMQGKLVGTWRYRLWKTGWILSAIPLAELAIQAALMTFGGIEAVILSCISAFTGLISMSLSFRLGIDLLRVMTFCIFMFEGLELACLLINLLLPRIMPKLYEKFPGLKGEHSHYDHLPDEDDSEVASGALLTTEQTPQTKTPQTKK